MPNLRQSARSLSWLTLPTHRKRAHRLSMLSKKIFEWQESSPAPPGVGKRSIFRPVDERAEKKQRALCFIGAPPWWCTWHPTSRCYCSSMVSAVWNANHCSSYHCGRMRVRVPAYPRMRTPSYSLDVPCAFSLGPGALNQTSVGFTPQICMSLHRGHAHVHRHGDHLLQ